MIARSFRQTLLASLVAIGVAACSDSEVKSPGETSQVDTGGTNTGTGTGTGTGSQTGTCPAGTTSVTAVGNNTTCQLTGNITSNLTLTSGVVYQLTGKVEVGVDVGGDGNKAGGQPVTLTIQPGVRLFGNSGADLLVVNRGSKIIADGTSTLPIIMTSRQDILGQATATSRGQWGGLVILGRAPINACPGTGGLSNCEAQVEGTTAFYGGAETNDNSGILRYLQVRHSGFEVTPNNELNGITLAGVGAGTTIDFVQVHNSSDDGIEWFGGTVNAKHLVLTGISDDSLDWASGWVGNIQYALVIQATDEGDTMIEADNLPATHTKTPLTAPNLANFTFVGRSNRNTAIVQRVGVGGRLLNGVVVGSPRCLDIDDAATTQSGLRYDSILFDCTTAFAEDTNVTAAQVGALFNAGTNNVIGASSLVSQYFPGPREQAMTAFNAATVSGFFATTTFVGAFSPTETASSNWAFGWTNGVFAPPTCPNGTTNVGTLTGLNRCEVRGTITSNLHLTAGNIYQVTGKVEVGNDVGGDGTKAGGQAANLTIDAGVTLFGNSGADFVVVNRGSKIFANGTSTQPVVFTALADVNNTASASGRGLWGGLVILGRAPINSCPGTGGLANCEAQVEGTTNFYGGALATDSSGRLNYVQVKHSGFEVTPNNELNGITLAGVGSGTEIDYVQVHNSSDDGIEWFGGTVNAKHLVLTGISDDSLDWASGYIGNLQFALVIQATDEGDTMIEADNLPSSHTKTPLTAPTLSNFTFVGRSNRNTGIVQRVGVGGRLLNGVVVGSPRCLDIDDAATTQSGLQYHSILFDCTTAFAEDTNVTAAQVGALFNAGTNNTTTTVNTLTNTFVNGATESARTVFNATTISSFFTSVPYIGAVRNATDTWWQGWTCGVSSTSPAC